MADLKGQENLITGTLPGGWKQRLALGCAVLHKPPIIFLDEPTSGVDPISRRQFWDLIHHMAEEGVTVFVTTHYMDEAEYCNRLALIYRGKIVALGTPSELKRKSMEGELLLVECEPLGSAVEVLQSAPDVLDAAVFGNALHLVVRDAAAARTAGQKVSVRSQHHGWPRRENPPQPGRCFRLSHNRARLAKGTDSMSLTRLLAVAKKEVVQILRDSRSLIIVVIMPVILVLLFGYGVNLDLKHLPVYVYDRDGSQQSQDLLKRFQASDYFDIVRVVDNYPALARALDDGHAKMGMVVPWDFSQRLHDGRPAQVQALVDATDDNTANVLIGYSQAVVQGYSSEIQLNWLRQPRPTRPARSRQRRNAHLVQRGSREQRIHRPRRACAGHVGDRRVPYLAHHRARVGARHAWSN